MSHIHEGISLPSSWRWVRFRDICSGNGQYGTSIQAHNEVIGLPMLRMGNIQDGQIVWDDLKFADLPSAEKDTYLLQKGDLIFNRTNSAELVGKSAVFDGSREAIYASYLIRFRLLPKVADPNFVCAYINSERGRAFIESKMTRAIGQVNVSASTMHEMEIPLPEFPEQQLIAKRLNEQYLELKNARIAVEDQIKATELLVDALLCETLKTATLYPLNECLREVTVGVGGDWARYPVLGATRAGVAPAKDPVGKNPQRYKPVHPGTIFYNPMRILLGSIAMVDDGEESGITSPDYVVMTGVEKRLHSRWFYYWFRSKYGAEFIKSLSRGAVRERLLFKRLAPNKIKIPDWKAQETFARQLNEIRRLRIALKEKLNSIEAIPKKLLRETFSSNI
jgi:type I restriction enzyme, S subunit